MRKYQQEQSFENSYWTDSSTERSIGRTFESFGRLQPLDTGRYLTPQTKAMAVVCRECGKTFTTKSTLPECPRCGGSDIDLV